MFRITRYNRVRRGVAPPKGYPSFDSFLSVKEISILSLSGSQECGIRSMFNILYAHIRKCHMTADSAPPISFGCSNCNAVLEGPPSLQGQVIECPECHILIQIPESVPAPAAGGPKKMVIKRPASTAPRATPAAHRPKSKAKKQPQSPFILIMSLFILLAVGAGGWLVLGGGGNQTGGEGAVMPRPGGGLMTARASGSGGSLPASGPQGPQVVPPDAGNWQLGNRPDVTAFQWGGSGREEIFDMVARQNGNMILSGMLPSRDGIPASVTHHHLLDNQGDRNFGFVAEIAADGREMLWFATFGGELFRPEVLALSPDGRIAVGGRALERGRGHAGIQGDFRGRSSAVGLIEADGSRVLWMTEGGPNQNTIEGLAVAPDGMVYFVTGGRGQGHRAYIMRRNADGSPSSFPKARLGGNENWAINFDVRDEEFRVPGQIGAFYAKGVNEAYAYDGPDGWGAVRWWLHGIRQGGSIVFLPNGDFVVAGTLQYDFVKGRDRRFPAFDLIMARYNRDGELLWSTNLYQEGDSVHTPDQKDHHLIYNPVNGDLYVLAIQHGSNVYRFKGELLGDTGNLMIGWIGQVNPENGALRNGWYWQSNRNGQYTERGSPRSPPHPRLSGNRPHRLAVDGEGRIYMAGSASPRMFTTGNAWRDWPEEQGGGGNPGVVILSPNLDRYEFASTLRGDDFDNGTANAIIVNEHGVWVAGQNGTRNFPAGPQPPWANAQPAGERDKFLVNLRF
jgi:hypothetical protein